MTERTTEKDIQGSFAEQQGIIDQVIRDSFAEQNKMIHELLKKHYEKDEWFFAAASMGIPYGTADPDKVRDMRGNKFVSDRERLERLIDSATMVLSARGYTETNRQNWEMRYKGS